MVKSLRSGIEIHHNWHGQRHRTRQTQTRRARGLHQQLLSHFKLLVFCLLEKCGNAKKPGTKLLFFNKLEMLSVFYVKITDKL
jgi:hypothetical protein